MNIKIYVTGEKLEKFYIEGIKEYEKRLSRYCKFQLQYFKNEDQLLKKLPNKTHKISLSLTGNKVTSEELAYKIDHLGISGLSDVTFIIGTDKILSDEVLTISSLDMNSSLMTLIMIEQIYRAYRILNNEPYHK